MDFITKYAVELIFGLISAGLLAFCRYLSLQIKDYKKLLEQRENDLLDKTIEEKIAPIIDMIHELQVQMQALADKETEDMAKVASTWRYRIIQLCNIYLSQGFMTQSQYRQLLEMYTAYHDLGGNGPVTSYYTKAIQLPVVPDEE